MGILDHFVCTNINVGLHHYRETPGAVLLDVRSPEEYQHRRVPESRNLPMEELNRVVELVPDRNTPLYVYAYSSETSGKAVRRLKAMGYAKAHNIGGIKNCCGNQGYKGPVEGYGRDSCPLR